MVATRRQLKHRETQRRSFRGIPISTRTTRPPPAKHERRKFIACLPRPPFASHKLGHGTWTSNHPTNTGIADSHMLDLLVCSTALHKQTRNCYTILDGLDSDHCATALALNLTSIKFKAKSSLNRGDIDWRIICEEETHRTMYNKYLMQLT